jgi:hypothetical protein
MGRFLAFLHGAGATASGYGSPGKKWYLLLTKHRQERVLARELSELGLNCFSPTARRSVRYGELEVVVEQPVCPDEAFLLGSESEAAIAQASPRVIGCRPVELKELLRTAALVDAPWRNGIPPSKEFERTPAAAG